MDLIESLKSSPIFSRLPETSLQVVVSCMKPKMLKKGGCIIQSG